MHAGDANSDAHTYTASTLPIETFPQPSPLLWKILLIDRILRFQVLKNNVAFQIVSHSCLLISVAPNMNFAIVFMVLENIMFLFSLAVF